MPNLDLALSGQIPGHGQETTDPYRAEYAGAAL